MLHTLSREVRVFTTILSTIGQNMVIPWSGYSSAAVNQGGNSIPISSVPSSTPMNISDPDTPASRTRGRQRTRMVTYTGQQ
jgi:hypothetical protein